MSKDKGPMREISHLHHKNGTYSALFSYFDKTTKLLEYVTASSFDWMFSFHAIVVIKYLAQKHRGGKDLVALQFQVTIHHCREDKRRC